MNALQDDTVEEALENLHAPLFASFGQDAVIWNIRIKIVAEEPFSRKLLISSGYAVTPKSGVNRLMKLTITSYKTIFNIRALDII